MSAPALEHEGSTYPLLLRVPTYSWWRPVVGLLGVLVGMLLLVPVLLLPVLALTVALDHEGTYSAAFRAASSLDPVSWQGLLYLNLTLGALVAVTCLVVRVVHGVRPAWLLSVTARFRWRFFWACFGIAVVAIGVQVLVGSLLPGDPNDLGGAANTIDGEWIALAVVVLLTTPLQAVGEEFAFRGYLIQAFGALTRRPWVAIVLGSLLFALAHGVQNAPLFLDRFVFGLMAGYVVLRTGGLEAGIALHVWNNLVAFGLALAIGSIDDTLTVSEVGWDNIVLTLTQNGVYLALVLLVATRMGIAPRTRGPVLLARTPSV